ncbi:MAG: anhydro-N-acetylmuramic acid kinase [Candidatus Nitrotoga sp.]|nr:anhydro-N-acetylmuramic acid kinase [Candidatus Nitrotoga sp.]MDO9446306.1 anhydro-N-acetylmuramic acid kinase [Candidatus Nitrotoga sp.]MDP3496589.1 anhydro-N-acetylmuramic acid kinase [Candidatus Nitrotoga sp.]
MAQNHSEFYIGIMSGTSLDGIDVVLVDFSTSYPKLLATYFQAYGRKLKDTLLTLHHPANDELHQMQLISNELASLYAAATATLLHTTNITLDQIRAIGCHGQTIRHRPSEGYTLQLGNAALLAELSGITVVSDFRSRDIAAGGQGAPLVPAFHDKVLRHPSIHRVIVNIGGISNLTNLPPKRHTVGFDCGPGNILMDAWIALKCGESYDRDGAWAASGQIIPALLHKLLDESFLHAVPPKSSGRDLFNLAWLNSKLRGDELPVDVQATLLAFSNRVISDAIHRFCDGAQEIYLCGGGARNKALVQSLGISLPDCRIQTTDTLGMGADWLEAIAFAWLAQQRLYGYSVNLVTVTGARHPCILGAIYST